MYFTSRGPGLKIHEKSLADNSVYESKPSDDWRHMSEADSKCNCAYITSCRIKNQYICVDCLMWAHDSVIRYCYRMLNYSTFRLKITSFCNVMLCITVCRHIPSMLLPKCYCRLYHIAWGYIVIYTTTPTFLDFRGTGDGIPERHSISDKPQLVLSHFHPIFHS